MTRKLPTDFRKSSRSGNQPECVEIAQNAEFGRIRDSKNPTGGAITVPKDNLAAFITTVKNGTK